MCKFEHPFVQFKFSVWPQASRHTHARAQCSHTSVELAQARPKNIRSIEIVPEQNRMLLYLCRAVATGLVSPVSTGPLFPSLVAYLVLPIIAPLLGGRPRNAPKHIGTMLKVVKWLRTMRQNCSASLPSNNFPFLQGNDS